MAAGFPSSNEMFGLGAGRVCAATAGNSAQGSTLVLTSLADRPPCSGPAMEASALGAVGASYQFNFARLSAALGSAVQYRTPTGGTGKVQTR